MSRSDANANFSLDAYPPDLGSVPGTYRVSVRKTEPSWQTPVTAESHDAPVEEESRGPKSLIPPGFGEFETSGLTI